MLIIQVLESPEWTISKRVLFFFPQIDEFRHGRFQNSQFSYWWTLEYWTRVTLIQVSHNGSQYLRPSYAPSCAFGTNWAKDSSQVTSCRSWLPRCVWFGPWVIVSRTVLQIVQRFAFSCSFKAILTMILISSFEDLSDHGKDRPRIRDVLVCWQVVQCINCSKIGAFFRNDHYKNFL